MAVEFDDGSVVVVMVVVGAVYGVEMQWVEMVSMVVM